MFKMKFNFKQHMIGNEYDFTESNMNAVIKEMERLMNENAELSNRLFTVEDNYKPLKMTIDVQAFMIQILEEELESTRLQLLKEQK